MKTLLESQYRSALAMFRAAVEQFPDELWNDPVHVNPTWRMAYHTLFYLHLYLTRTEPEFRPWEGAIPGAHFMDSELPPRADGSAACNTKEEIVAYHDMLTAWLPAALAADDLGERSGFDWISMGRPELHVYNIRHAQHHIGQLAERLRAHGLGAVRWVGRVPD